MQVFTNLPWVNIIFSEKTVMALSKHFRDDGANKYEEMEGGLNRMSISKFENIVRESGMKMQYIKYDCVKGMNIMQNIPVIRELFINHASCILRK